MRHKISLMNESAIIITGVHLTLTDAMKNIVTEKVSKLFKHEPSIVRVRVELVQDTSKKDQGEFMAKGHIQIQGPDLVVAVYSENLYKAIDALVEKLQRKIRRRSRLLKVRRKQNLITP
ncbi:MAG: ribosome-associated translation inhibitor RaiA [Puniceicoccales bacterium]|nr:ribosome-associated translation inhibitor RaiA [Puniceicoccales bacterium]